MGPLGLGMYGIANSQVQTPGYAGLLDPMTGEPMEGGGGGGGFSMGFGGQRGGRINGANYLHMIATFTLRGLLLTTTAGRSF